MGALGWNISFPQIFGESLLPNAVLSPVGEGGETRPSVACKEPTTWGETQILNLVLSFL